MTPALSSLLTVIGLWLGVAVLCCAGSPIERKPLPTSGPPITVSAERVISEYKANEIAADRSYKGNVLRVTGRVDHIGKDIVDSMYVTLRGTNEFEFVRVQCFFEDDWAARLSYLREGDTVTVQGRCDGKFGNVLLKDCVFPSQ